MKKILVIGALACMAFAAQAQTFNAGAESGSTAGAGATAQTGDYSFNSFGADKLTYRGFYGAAMLGNANATPAAGSSAFSLHNCNNVTGDSVSLAGIVSWNTSKSDPGAGQDCDVRAYTAIAYQMAGELDRVGNKPAAEQMRQVGNLIFSARNDFVRAAFAQVGMPVLALPEKK